MGCQEKGQNEGNVCLKIWLLVAGVECWYMSGLWFVRIAWNSGQYCDQTTSCERLLIRLQGQDWGWVVDTGQWPVRVHQSNPVWNICKHWTMSNCWANGKARNSSFIAPNLCKMGFVHSFTGLDSEQEIDRKEICHAQIYLENQSSPFLQQSLYLT